MSKTVRTRLKSHIDYANSNYDSTLVHAAMRKHDYSFELIENCNGMTREQLGKREIFWIDYYDSYNNGYNMTPGGDGTTEITGVNNPSSKITEKQLQEIYHKLIYDKDLYIYQIAEQYNMSKEAISEINCGRRYFNEKLKYPLREPPKPFQNVKSGYENHQALFSKKDIDNIYYDLKYNTNISLAKLAQKYGCSYVTISKINRGLSYQKEGYTDFPVRENKRTKPLNSSQLKEVYDLILNTDLKLSEIGKRYNISKDTVSKINTGLGYNKSEMGYIYPLRENLENNKAVSTIHGSVEQDNY